MSLKSFDKFCENIILGENGAEKPIYDERQNIVRSQQITEALIIYACLTAINTFFMEAVYQWCSSYFVTLALFGVICVIWWLIRCSAKGALFGVNGTTYAKFVSSCWIGIGLFNTITYLFQEEPLLENGMVGESFLLMISFSLLGLCGIYYLAMACREDKRREREEQADK
ncbi:MAG: hypothetical protein ACI4J1_08870 [Ruminiclostridium sp.]